MQPTQRHELRNAVADWRATRPATRLQAPTRHVRPAPTPFGGFRLLYVLGLLAAVAHVAHAAGVV